MRLSRILLVPTLLLFGVAPFLTGCSSSTTPSSNNFTVQADMTSSQVSGIAQSSKDGSQGATIHRITITSMKFLISEIKLDAKSDGTEIKVKDKAAILSVDSSGSHLSSIANVPAATYNKISIKFHRLNDAERASVLSDPAYQEFIGNDRYSVIIHGNEQQADSSWVPFTFAGRLDETLKLDMADINVTDNGMTIVSIKADPSLIFKENVNGVLLDPLDSTNQSVIENHVKLSLKAEKK